METRIKSIDLDSRSELFQKPEIVLRIQAEIVDPVFKLTNSFDSHAECESGETIAVNAEILQHFRMYHSASKDLNPSRMLTHITS